MADNKFGIYFNTSTGEILRINSPYWIPEAAEWIYITDEVNATLLEVKQAISDRKLMKIPQNITWGVLPDTIS
ncbi:MAG: hypothetical protein FI694_05310 [SAR202 cluster bacterium]|nr:hypothetical protein [SAR202 cluster bacterium]|tara:strand:+ start:7261 stop:7479 length:219 start_codon:yes stop_codon:yes gene_type:complete